MSEPKPFRKTACAGTTSATSAVPATGSAGSLRSTTDRPPAKDVATTSGIWTPTDTPRPSGSAATATDTITHTVRAVGCARTTPTPGTGEKSKLEDYQRKSMSKFKPMLAEALPAKLLNTCPLPMIAMAKLDGLRCLVQNGLKSRTLKPIPNQHTRSLFERPELEGMDGELIVGSPNSPTVFQDSQSGIMRHKGEPDVFFFVFDLWDCPELPYLTRLRQLTKRVAELNDPRVIVVSHQIIHGIPQLEDFEGGLLEDGYEGVILRHPNAPYKHGRSTLKQAWMLKLKRFEDSEAEIVGFVEGRTNNNPAETDARGLTIRSTRQSNMVPSGTLGAFAVRDVHHGWEFEIGTGFTQAEAAEFWENRETYLGKLVKYQYFSVGMKDSPRFPSYKGIRHRDDTEIKVCN